MAARVVDRRPRPRSAPARTRRSRWRSRAGGSGPAPRAAARARRSSVPCSWSRPRRTIRRTSRSARAPSRTLPDATQWSGVVRPVQSPTAMRLGPSAWATVSIVSPSRTPRPVVSWVSRARRSSSGHGDPAQVERPLGPFGQADDDEAQPVLAGLVVLLDEAALLERGQQPRRRGLVQAEPAGQFGHAGLALAVPEGQQQGRGPVDRADGIPVEDHPVRPVHVLSRPPGEDMPPCGGSSPARRARDPRAPRRASR